MRPTRILLLLLGFVGAMTMAACSSDEPSATSDGSTETTGGTGATGTTGGEESTTTTSAAPVDATTTSTTAAATSTTVAGRDVSDPSASVKSGDSGEGVKMIQYTLVANGYQIGVDGVFGPVTETAVRDFQKKQGLTVDGVVGPLTWSALQSAAGMTTTTAAGGAATSVESTTTTG